MKEFFNFRVTTEIVFGAGVATQTGEIARRFQVHKTLVVTDPGILQSKILEPVFRSLKEAGIESNVFSHVVPNPHLAVIAEGVNLCRQTRTELVIGIGGGSAIDAAKAIGLMATNPGSIADYAGVNKSKLPPLPLIAIPTTAGTGSEVTTRAVVRDAEKQRKFSVIGHSMAPQVAICDSLLTMTMPPGITAATGMDALTHAIEAYTNIHVHPICDLLATKAIELIGKHLLVAVANGKNVEARSGMLLASLLGGISFDNNGLGAVHALTNPISSRFDVPHGLANAIMLPHVVEYNLIGNLEKFKEIARLLGEPVEGQSLRAAAAQAVVAIKQLIEQSGLPTGLRETGVKEELFEEMASTAILSGDTALNTRIPTRQDYIDLYHKAY